MKIVLLLVTILFLISCTYQVKQVSFEIIEKGYYSGIVEKQNLVIDSNESWSILWEHLKSNIEPAPSIPEIDFSKNTVIAVFQGEKSTGGYSIEVTKIEEFEGKIIVKIKERNPGPGEIVTEAFTQPYNIEKISKTNKKIEFQNE